MEQSCCKVNSLPSASRSRGCAIRHIPSWEIQKREVMQMDTYQVLSLLLLGGNFLIALRNQLRWFYLH